MDSPRCFLRKHSSSFERTSVGGNSNEGECHDIMCTCLLWAALLSSSVTHFQTFILFTRVSICCTQENFLKIKNSVGSLAIIVTILCSPLLSSLSHFCCWSCCSQSADSCVTMMVPLGSSVRTSLSPEVQRHPQRATSSQACKFSQKPDNFFCNGDI